MQQPSEFVGLPCRGDSKYSVIVWLHVAPGASTTGYKSSNNESSAVGTDCSSSSSAGFKSMLQGGAFCMEFGGGLTIRFQPQHGTVIGLQSARIKHYTDRVIESNGWHQIGVALVHKQATVTGCLKVQALGQRANLISKALGSTSQSRSAAAVQQLGESLAAAEACLGKAGANTTQLSNLLSCVEGLHTGLSQRVKGVATRRTREKPSGLGVINQQAQQSKTSCKVVKLRSCCARGTAKTRK